MDLSDVYSSKVCGKSVLNNVSFGGHFPNIERDPIFDKLENSVLSKFNEILKINEDIDKPVINNNQINTIDFENALKELISFKNKEVTLS